MKLQTTQTSPMCRGLLQKRGIEPEWFATDKLKSIKYYGISNTGNVPIKFTKETEQERVLAKNGFGNAITYKALPKKEKDEDRGRKYSLQNEGGCFSFVPDFFEEETT